MFEVKDARPPPTEPYDSRYQYGVSTVIWPDGSAMCLAHDSPDELRDGMWSAWTRAMHETTTERRRERMPDDFYKDLGGDTFTFENVGDQLVGVFSNREKRQGMQGEMKLVVTLTEPDGTEQTVWCPRDLAQEFKKQQPELGAKLRITLIELKHTGQPSPMKIFTLEVAKEKKPEPEPAPVGADEEPF